MSNRRFIVKFYPHIKLMIKSDKNLGLLDNLCLKLVSRFEHVLRLVLLCKLIGGSVVFDSEFVSAVSGGGDGELGEPGRGEDGG